jgi:hypothetical protein
MEAILAELCERTEKNPDGTISLIRILREAHGPTFPAVLAPMTLVVSLRYTSEEVGHDVTLRAVIVSPDGEEIGEAAVTQPVPAFTSRVRRFGIVNIHARIENVNISAPGDYDFHLFVQGQPARTVTFPIYQQ